MKKTGIVISYLLLFCIFVKDIFPFIEYSTHFKGDGLVCVFLAIFKFLVVIIFSLESSGRIYSIIKYIIAVLFFNSLIIVGASEGLYADTFLSNWMLWSSYCEKNWLCIILLSVAVDITLGIVAFFARNFYKMFKDI